MKVKNYLKTVVWSMMIFTMVVVGISYHNHFYASTNFSEEIFLSDGKGSVYHVVRTEEQVEVWKFWKNDKTKVFTGVDKFDYAVCSDGTLYMAENKNYCLYVVQISDNKNTPEAAEVRLGSEYMMAAVNDVWYFTDKTASDTVIKYDSYRGTSEKTLLSGEIKELFTDTVSKKVFALTEKGIIPIDSGTLISCEIPVLPVKVNGNIYTDSMGDKYVFNSSQGFEKILNTEYEKICGTVSDTYALWGHQIYRLDENGAVYSVYHADFDISDIMTSGSNLYAITDTEAVYISEKYFVKYENEISVAENSKEESEKSEKSDTIWIEPSKVESQTEIAVQEQSKPKYMIDSDTYEILQDMIFISEGTTIAQFKTRMNYGDYRVSFTNHNGKQVTSGQMGTGWRVDFIGSGEMKSYYTIVSGDVTGEGNVNTRDLYLLRDYLFGKTEFSKYQCEAIDLKKNGIIDSVDMYFLVKDLKSRGIL